MIIGVPKEIRKQEFRVGMVPAGVTTFTAHGHKILVEKGAGEEAGFSDEKYLAAGAELVSDAEELWSRAQFILKVQGPVSQEFRFFRENVMVFSYLNLANSLELTKQLEFKGVTSLAYETLQMKDGSLPLLKPMSEIAGKMATQKGANYLEKTNGGRGVLLGGVPGTRRGRVGILGGGVVGTNAAQVAIGMGAEVTLLDLNLDRLEHLDHLFGGRLNTLFSNPDNIAETVERSDLLIGAVLIPGAKTPHLVTEDLIKTMTPGSVIVDVAIDQGGCFASSQTTSHDDATYIRHGVVHYCVPNMPASVARTSTMALTNATTHYALKLADRGFEQAIREDHALYVATNSYRGHITYEAVAEACGVAYKPLAVLL